MSLTPKQDDLPLELFTVGHSNYPMEDFIALIGMFGIEVVADVRSNPYARYATHFTGPFLKKALTERGIKYVFLGQELGGKLKEPEFYDEDGHADYAKLAVSQKFNEGMERLERGLQKFRVAIMCGEEDPSGCHRHLLVSKVAIEKGFIVKHIRKGGEVQDYLSFRQSSTPEDLATQLTLFTAPTNAADEEKDSQWRSKVRIKE